MGLNIKNPRVHELARQAAAVTGKSQTGAIEEALMHLLAEHGVNPAKQRVATKIDAVAAIVSMCIAESSPANASVTALAVNNPEIRTVEDLYDDAGLPL